MFTTAATNGCPMFVIVAFFVQIDLELLILYSGKHITCLGLDKFNHIDNNTTYKTMMLLFYELSCKGYLSPQQIIIEALRTSTGTSVEVGLDNIELIPMFGKVCIGK